MNIIMQNSTQPGHSFPLPLPQWVALKMTEPKKERRVEQMVI